MGQHPRKKKDLSPIQKALLFGRKVAKEFRDMPSNMREYSNFVEGQDADRRRDVAQMDSALAAHGMLPPREPWQAGTQPMFDLYGSRMKMLGARGVDTIPWSESRARREAERVARQKRKK